VNTTIDYVLTAEVEQLVLLGSSDIDGTGNGLGNLITGNGGNNILSGLGGNDTLVGGEGNDILDGGEGRDTLNGGNGDDVFIVDVVNDSIVETSTGGRDTVQTAIAWKLGSYLEDLVLTGTDSVAGTGNSLANTITGNAGANLLGGESGNDTLYGGLGDDTLNGGSNNDDLYGGTGNDTFIVDNLGDRVFESGAGSDTVQSSVAFTLGALVEALVLTGSAGIAGTGNTMSNVITGNTGGNALNGDAGADTLYGGAGADTLDGGTGGDRMEGGTGSDTYVVDNAGDVLLELAAGGTDTVRSSIAWTLGAELEALVLTGAGAINGTGNALANTITGNGANNRLFGLDGADTMAGGDGDDSLDGGTGNDSMTGGAGNDTFVVDSTGDRVSEAAGGGTDTVQTALAHTLASNVENLVLTGAAAVNGTGNTLANTLTGNNAANGLYGGSGDDTILGGGGADTLDGGTGADSLTGGAGNDTYVVDDLADSVTEIAGQGRDTVRASVSQTLGAEVEDLVLTGTAALNGTGNDLGNRLTGNSAVNILSGGLGADTLAGLSGNDNLTGGGGADAFVFLSTSSGTDTITDFNAVGGSGAQGDTLRFEGLLVGTFAYLGTGTFTGGFDNSEARVSGDTVQIDSDGNGSADITIRLTGLTAATQLTAVDFVWV
jgi:Ca2+-binding RTX toxin-like protein